MVFSIKIQLFESVKFRGSQQWSGGPEHSLQSFTCVNTECEV